MSKMRLVMFAMALASAIMAGLLAKGVLGKKQEEKVVEVNTVKTVDVLVAAKDIHMGEKFADGTLVWKAWPKDNLQPSMVTKDAKPEAMQEMATSRARVALYDGEVVFDKKVLNPGDGGFMGAMLAKGMRAASVTISNHSSAGGFILPDDRVDSLVLRSIAENDGKALKDIMPELTDKFSGKAHRGGIDTLVVRYGVENHFSSN